VCPFSNIFVIPSKNNSVEENKIQKVYSTRYDIQQKIQKVYSTRYDIQQRTFILQSARNFLSKI
jgi:hypothetical protein